MPPRGCFHLPGSHAWDYCIACEEENYTAKVEVGCTSSMYNVPL